MGKAFSKEKKNKGSKVTKGGKGGKNENTSNDSLSVATTTNGNNTQTTAVTSEKNQSPNTSPVPSPDLTSTPNNTSNNNNQINTSGTNNNTTNNSTSSSLKDNGATEVSLDSSNMGEEDEGPEEIIFSKNKQSVTKDDFELLTVIGKGSFGKVMQVKKKDDQKIYAMKVLRKDAIIARKQVNHTKSEKTILQCVSHPFIVNLHFAFQTRDKLYMILDFVNGGELFFHLKREGRFSEPRVKLYAAEIVSALDHLHKQDIVYRDLKPENILLDSEGHICITDFGLSKKIETTDGTFTFCGTPEYLAPEVLNGHGHGCAVDWWSLGTLLYEMLTGLPPFYSQNVSMMYQKILNGELKIPSYISPEAKSLLEGLLTREVDKRLGTKGGNEVKQHPWFRNIDWDKLDRKEVEVHFKPKVKSGTDVSQIDPAFTQERPMDSVVEGSTLGDAVNKDNSFEGFTYVADSILKV